MQPASVKVLMLKESIKKAVKCSKLFYISPSQPTSYRLKTCVAFTIIIKWNENFTISAIA